MIQLVVTYFFGPGILTIEVCAIAVFDIIVVWKQAMENLKESVVMRQYQGRDPLSEYTAEAFALFKGLEDSMRVNAVFSLWQSFVAAAQPVAA